jgi:hypothetical protein
VRVTRSLSKDEFVCYEYLMKRYMVIWPPPRPVSVFDSLWQSIARFFGSLAESFSLSSDSSSASEFANVNYERVAADSGDQEIQLHEFETTVAANRATVALSPARSSPTAASLTASLPPS